MSATTLQEASLRGWRQILRSDGSAGVLIGVVENHPRSLRGWILSSPLIRLDRHARIGFTQNTMYWLHDEYPVDKRMPVGAFELLEVIWTRDPGYLGALCDLPRGGDLGKVYDAFHNALDARI